MKIKVYIHAAYSEYDHEYHFQPWQHDMSSQAHCGPMVGTVEFDFDPPPKEVLLKGQIEAYREQQKQVRAEAERMCNEIQGRINDMLCLEHKTDTAAV